ncbi:hypothetical protein [Cohnella thermotolerans]|uniref:hypothetical protein n=1 Tax=Cohnella thermotolerans TaxID=329858 RepID=UPI000401469C|nr:hypothetical protein [Cohnella thermotolerans]
MNKRINGLFKRMALTAGAALAIAGTGYAGFASAAVAEDSAQTHPAFGPHHHKEPVWILTVEGKEGNAPLLSLLKIDAETLESRLRSGESLADIAKKQGVDKMKVVDLLVAQQNERLNEAVKSGQLTEEQASRWRSGLQERTERLVEKHHSFGQGMGRRKARYLEDTAQVLGMSPRSLLEELKKGKSIVQIGKEKGIAEDTIVSKLLDKEKVRIKERIHRIWGNTSQVKSHEKNDKN